MCREVKGLGKIGGKWQRVRRMEKERKEREKTFTWAEEKGALGEETEVEDRGFLVKEERKMGMELYIPLPG